MAVLQLQLLTNARQDISKFVLFPVHIFVLRKNCHVTRDVSHTFSVAAPDRQSHLTRLGSPCDKTSQNVHDWR